MTTIIIWLVVIFLVVAFLIFLAMDDRKNQRIRAEEDRIKALQTPPATERDAGQ